MSGEGGIVFSSWKSERFKKLEFSDMVSIYIDILDKYKEVNEEDIFIFIEDLDRISQKKLVSNFLKKVYRYGNFSKNRKVVFGKKRHRFN